MGRKDRWLANSNGPDWTDISTTIRELEKLHGAWISVRMLNGGSRFSNSLRIVVSAFTNELVKPAEAGMVMLQGGWPSKENATLEGAVYALLLELDFKCSEKMWIQQELF